MHESIPISPVELINMEPTDISPLISKCQIKVCYVGDGPNRNKSIITKDVAKKMAPSLRGAAIVGYYNELKEDYEEHNRVIDISNGQFDIKDTTFPYGFVDIGAKVWFQKFLDDGKNEHEYLMTEGYIWSDIYPESKRIIEKGNNQSMELDDKKIKAHWSKDENGMPEFFIINEAIIKKLCILGEDCEPCFEGANITAPSIHFSFSDKFNEQLFSMMKDLKELLEDKGGTKVFTRYNVEINDPIWTSLYSYIKDFGTGNAVIEEVCEDNGNLFAVVKEDDKFVRLDFSMKNDIFTPGEVSELTDYTVAEEPQFDPAKVAEFVENFAKKKDEKGKDNKENNDNNQKDNSEEENESTENPDNKPEDDSNEEEDKKKKKVKYSLEDVVEYGLLKKDFDELEAKYNALVSEKENLDKELASLSQFKKNIEKKEKEEMIKSFYMLSDDDKKDVIDNIDTYSLDDIEAKLSIICVRNKVSFELDKGTDTNNPLTYNINEDSGNNEDEVPAWFKAARDVAKSMN